MGLWEVLSLHQVTLGSSKNGAPEASWPPALSQRELRLGGQTHCSPSWGRKGTPRAAPSCPCRQGSSPEAGETEAEASTPGVAVGGWPGHPSANREPSLDRPPQNNASAVQEDTGCAVGTGLTAAQLHSGGRATLREDKGRFPEMHTCHGRLEEPALNGPLGGGEVPASTSGTTVRLRFYRKPVLLRQPRTFSLPLTFGRVSQREPSPQQ